MDFLVGTYFLSANVTSCRAHVAHEYKEESNTHQTNQSIDLNGVVVADGRLGAQILIDGRKELGGLPIDISIRRGSPDEIEDLTDRQTRHIDKDFHWSVIKRAVGWFRYSRPITDKEAGRTFPERLYAEIVAEDWILNDLWYAMRMPGAPITRFNITLFGDQMQQVQDYIRHTYHWSPKAENYFDPLYIASFHYMTETRT